MNEEVISKIIYYISIDNHIIPDEVIDNITKWTIDLVLSDNNDYVIPDEFWKLANVVEDFFVNKKYTNSDPVHVYQMGRIKSLIEMIAENKKELDTLSKYIPKEKKKKIKFIRRI